MMRRWTTIGLGVMALLPATAQANARPAPALGNGLGRLTDARPSALRAAGVRIDDERLAIRDAEGRVLVNLGAAQGVDLKALQTRAEAAGMKVTASLDGIIEGYIATDKARGLAAVAGAATLALSPKPIANAGATTSQGVAFQRVDKLPGAINGTGITIAALSDSFDAAEFNLGTGEPETIHAAQDVASGDLPPGVTVLEDLGPGDDATDEGRAMLQIVHDVAPKSKLCFASAFTGFVSFAQNVLDLADKSGPCGADVLVDDVSYFDEPFFSDSILTDAIDKVSAQGAHYFSSVGNAGDANGWESRVRLVNAKKNAREAGLDFSQVDPALYDGGLQDMDPGQGTDVAQDITLGENGGLIDLQWDDPFDIDGATLAATPLLSTAGELTDAAPEADIPFPIGAGDVGKTIQIKIDGVPSGSTDLVLGLLDPAGNQLAEVDTGSSPEVFAFKPATAGTYTIVVTGFAGDTGQFTVDAREVLAPSRVSTDFNLLLFGPDGDYLGSVADLNQLSGRPTELVGLAGPGELQLVISRAGTGPVGATRLRNVLNDDIAFSEYADPLAPATFGHPEGKSTIAVGAYDPFKPFLPEPFTSPGGDLPVFFDSDGNRFRRPSIRRVPSVSATDGANTTFFVRDTLRDPDVFPNFSGTSASAPHAAAIGGLVLQKAGGGSSLDASGLRNVLQRSTFAHDLDPDYAEGDAGGLSVSAAGAQGEEAFLLPGTLNDPRFFRLRYDGRSPISSITFYGEFANPTGRGVGYDDPSEGLVFDTRPFTGGTLGDQLFRLDGFPFTVGATGGGLKASDVTASYSGKAPQSEPGQFRHLTLTFSKKAFRSGASLKFGIDRDEAITGNLIPAAEGNGADSLGGAVFIPSGVKQPAGMRFVGRRADGSAFSGAIRNQLGNGWTPLDGYGVIDAEEAVRSLRRR